MFGFLVIVFQFPRKFWPDSKAIQETNVNFLLLILKKTIQIRKGYFLFIIDISEVGFHDYDLLGAILAPYHYKEHCQVSSKSADGFLKY